MKIFQLAYFLFLINFSISVPLGSVSKGITKKHLYTVSIIIHNIFKEVHYYLKEI